MSAVLDRRARALLDRDRVGFLATVDPLALRFRARQAAVFRNLARVPLAGWRYEIDGAQPARLAAARRHRLGGQAWAPRVVTSYRLRGLDAAPVTTVQALTFVRRAGRWYLAADRDAGAPRTELWDLGPVFVVRGRHSLVLGLQPRQRLRTYAEEVDRAVPRVTAVWGRHWSQGAVVVVPRSEAQMSVLVGGRPGDYAQSAAVTRGEATGGRGPADRMVVNPDGFAQLEPVGRRIVVTHEMTHVATRRATSSTTPQWLAEGFADYVAYRRAGVPVRLAASELFSDIRRGRSPRRLPSDGEFAVGGARLAQAYEGSWLACRYVADRYGERRLLALYRAVGNSDEVGPLDRAVRRVLGVSTRQLTGGWRAYLRRQAG